MQQVAGLHGPDLSSQEWVRVHDGLRWSHVLADLCGTGHTPSDVQLWCAGLQRPVEQQHRRQPELQCIRWRGRPVPPRQSVGQLHLDDGDVLQCRRLALSYTWAFFSPRLLYVQARQLRSLPVHTGPA